MILLYFPLCVVCPLVSTRFVKYVRVLSLSFWSVWSASFLFFFAQLRLWPEGAKCRARVPCKQQKSVRLINFHCSWREALVLADRLTDDENPNFWRNFWFVWSIIGQVGVGYWT